ncbi:hypothetical protein [Phenylobacterium sp.]|uniref:hypothetical protein n=1 Tax=Phenylobacterium sp. TaxID=1871053 RepID=UPI00351E2017
MVDTPHPSPSPADTVVSARSAPRAPQVESLGLDPGRPLVIVDVDEVLGHFMEGFGAFLAERGLEFRVERFALFQNIYRPGETAHLEIEEGRRHYDDFFRYGSGEMRVAEGAAEALRRLAEQAGVVILTNAPGQGRLARARWLGRNDLDYPLLLNTGPKGPLAGALAEQVKGPAAFIDDLLPNLDSVAETAPKVARFQHVADPRLRPLAPAAPDRHTRIDDWDALRIAIADSIS